MSEETYGNYFKQRSEVRRKLREAKANRNPDDVFEKTVKAFVLTDNGPAMKTVTYLTTQLEEDLKAEDARLKLLNNVTAGAFA